MTVIDRVEWALDCEGSERVIHFHLQGRQLIVVVLEKRGSDESGPDWSGATGALDEHDCDIAAEELHEWIRMQNPHSKKKFEECLTLKVIGCLFAWRNTADVNMRFRPKPGLDSIHIHIESLPDARFLMSKFEEYSRLLQR